MNVKVFLINLEKIEFKKKFDRYKQIAELRQKTIQQVEMSTNSVYNNLPIKVIALGTVFPGVEFHYRGTIEKINAPVTKCAFVFDPETIKPKVEAIRPEDI